MEFEIDISGEDLLSKNYTICIADRNGLIKGFKFNEGFIKILSSRYGQGLYKYVKSQKGKALLKVRIYSIIIYYLFKSIKINEEISLNICRDFQGRETDIKENLRFFLSKLLSLNINKIYFMKLDENSNAHHYAYLMRKDNKNKMKTYVKIKLEEIEKFLKK